MRAVLLISAKDLRQRARDRSVYLFALVVPLVLASILTVIFPSDTPLAGMRYVTVAADGEVGRAFTQQVLPAATESLGIELGTTEDAASARAAVEAGEADAAFVVPGDFDERVTTGRGSEIEVIASGAGSIAAQVAAALADEFAATLTASQTAVAATIAAGGAPRAAEQVVAAVRSATPLTTRADTSADRMLDPTTYLAAGMAIFFLFFTVQFGVLGLLEEDNAGTLARLRAAPIPRGSVHLAKCLTAFVLGVVSLAVLMLASSLLLGASWGATPGVAILVVAAVSSAIGIMAVISTFARTAEQAGNFQSIVAVVLGMLGGSFFPVVQGPGLLSRLSLVTPHAWFLRGLGELSGGATVTAVLPAAAALLAFATVGLLVAGVRVVRSTP